MVSPLLSPPRLERAIGPGRALSPALRERPLESKSRQSTPGTSAPGGSKKSSERTKHKIRFSGARDHHPEEEKAVGNLVVAVKTMED